MHGSSGDEVAQCRVEVAPVEEKWLCVEVRSYTKCTKIL
jgi:hypothetical protein